MNTDFLIRPDELTLRFQYPAGEHLLSFARSDGAFTAWKARAKDKLKELLGISSVAPGKVSLLREMQQDGIRIQALMMQVDADLSTPAYLLIPEQARNQSAAVMAIHGHGEVEALLPVVEDYHHQFGWELARNGYLVLCPELRGFGALRNMAAGLHGHRLDYWNWGGVMAYSLVTDGFQHGRTLIGDTVADLVRWEEWMAQEWKVEQVCAAGISYGGDLVLTYPIFSQRVERIFASGSLGSFEPIFALCYNASAHCIPGVLQWMDRADIAGMNAPCPIALHYGELDVPAADNYSASYNATVGPSIKELRAIYAAIGAQERVSLMVSPGKRHEMDNDLLLSFLREPV
jgi:dienelactone hydrolase